jgi:hypothetical protein
MITRFRTARTKASDAPGVFRKMDVDQQLTLLI